MTRDEFMKHAEQEIEQAFRGQRNRMMNLVEQAWAEGKRNAEIDVFTAAGNELVNVIKKELFPQLPTTITKHVKGGMTMKLRMRVVIYTEMEDDETIEDATGRVLNGIYGAGMNVYAYDGVELVD